MKRTKKQAIAAGERRKNEWKDQQRQFCWVCGRWASWNLMIVVHHMLKKAIHHPDQFDQAYNWFLICDSEGGEKCHTPTFHNRPIAEQLAIKRHYDPSGFGRLAWCLARNENAPEFVTMDEINYAAKHLGM